MTRVAAAIDSTVVSRVPAPACGHPVGYSSLLCAITFDSRVTELRRAEAKRDKTEVFFE